MRALDAALRLPEQIARADRRRMVVFLDEFQEVAGDRRPFGDPDGLTKRMRAIFQRTDHTSYLFAGSIEHVMRDLFAPQQRAFSGFGGFRALRPIESSAWTRGLRSRFEADDCEIDDATLTRIVELGEGHPRATMLIAQHTHLASVLDGSRTIEPAYVEAGRRSAMEAERGTLDAALDRIRRLHKRGVLMARRVAAGQPLHTGLRSGEGDRALKALRDAGILEHAGRGDWRLVDPFLRLHLLETAPFTSG